MLGVKPSFATEFAQWPGMSEQPRFWEGLVVAYAPFLGATGNRLLDWTGHGLEGTFVGTAPSWTSGKLGSAVLLPGDDEYIDIGDITNLDGATRLTITVLVNFSALAANANIVRKWRAGAASLLLSIDGVETDELKMAISDSLDNSLSTHTTNTNLVAGVWYWATSIWRGGNNGQILVDGIVKTMAATTEDTPVDIKATDEHLTIGNRWNNGSPDFFLNGLIGCVLIWNRAMRISEAILFHETMKRLAT